MPLLPKEYLQSVVAIGQKVNLKEFQKSGEPMRKNATGFLYGYPNSGRRKDEKSGFGLWLVTCKHVITEAVDEKGLNELLVRMNKSDQGEMQTFRIYLQREDEPEWTLHPTEDVAVIPTSVSDLESKGIQWQTFAAGRNAFSRKESLAFGLSEGDEVFILGFPTGWRSGRQDYPIVRHGVLAQVQGWLNQEHNTYLVDGSGFPGNSGGPVVTKPQISAIFGTKAKERSALIGMVSDRKLSDISTNLPNLEETGYLEETADIIEVVPMDSIDECIVLAMQEQS